MKFSKKHEFVWIKFENILIRKPQYEIRAWIFCKLRINHRYLSFTFFKAVLWRNWYPYTCTCTTFDLNQYLFYLEVLKLSEHLDLMIYWKGDVKKICCGFHVFGLLVCLIISILLVYFAHLLRQGLKISNTYTYTCTCRLLNFNRFLVA